ncbi:MAG: hypothetical protein WCT04_09115 [Planctomycetota bacterium]
MPRGSYSPDLKDKIVQAAIKARADHKTWAQAHKAATDLGYAGSLQGIIKLMRAYEKRQTSVVRRPGRPAGSKNSMKVSAIDLSTTGLDSAIASLVSNVANKRINEALDRAIAILQSMKV